MRFHLRRISKQVICIAVFYIILLFVQYQTTHQTSSVLSSNEREAEIFEQQQHHDSTFKNGSSLSSEKSLNNLLPKLENRKQNLLKVHLQQTTAKKQNNQLDGLYELFPYGDEMKDRVLEQLMVKHKPPANKTFTILFWRSPSKKDFSEQLVKDGCSMTNCILTRNRDFEFSADAIVFDGHFPNDVAMRMRGLRRHEYNPKQVRILYMLESPHHTDSLVQFKDLVNWTATYRRDSIINTPYERFTYFENYTGLPAKPLKNYATGKSKMAAWFVSNCLPINGRDKYVAELKKHIQVDIYGTCGTLHCPRNNEKLCTDYLNRDYKFYLSFENSNCKDYITEKFYWNALLNDIVPVVMGAHPEDYHRSAPPHSYIHVDDFESPKHLAEYLLKLDANDELYNQYFRWKGTGSFINTKMTCRLCAMVNIASSMPVWYSDINAWWRGPGICVTPAEVGKPWASWRNVTRSTQFAQQLKYGFTEL